jgi:hypothetical protein
MRILGSGGAPILISPLIAGEFEAFSKEQVGKKVSTRFKLNSVVLLIFSLLTGHRMFS